MISKREARKLATKLDAVPQPGGKHLKVPVIVDGVRATTFGISHDASKPNYHIAGNLGISQRKTQELARCTETKEWYFKQVRAQKVARRL